jgi:hypothetical protein
MSRPRFIPRVCRRLPGPDEGAEGVPAALRSEELLDVLRFAESAMRSAIDLLDTTQRGDLERGGDLAWALGRIKRRRRELESGLWIGRTVTPLAPIDGGDGELREID